MPPMPHPVNDFAVEFEPSPSIKRRWLAVRQERLALNPNSSKGFRGMHHAADGRGETFAFMMAVGAEVWVAWNTYLATDYPWWICFIVPPALCVALAVVGHVRASDECHEVAELEVTDSGNRQAQLKQAIGHKAIWRFAFGILVVLVALANGVLFFLARQKMDGVAFSVILGLLAATAIHVTLTGYFVWRLWYKSTLWLERRAYDANPAGAPTRFWGSHRYPHNAPELFTVGPFVVQQGRHWFTNIEVCTQGMLTDEDVVAIAANIHLADDERALEPMVQEVALRELRRHQLRILTNAPIPRRKGQNAAQFDAAPSVQEVWAQLPRPAKVQQLPKAQHPAPKPEAS